MVQGRQCNKGCQHIIIRIEKHLQCEELLGLAGENTKKRVETINPVRA